MSREYRSDKASNLPVRNTTKGYLQQVFETNRLIKTRLEQLNTLKDIATRISPHTDSVRVDGSSNRGNMATTVERSGHEVRMGGSNKNTLPLLFG